jgi:hypothetical protein
MQFTIGVTSKMLLAPRILHEETMTNQESQSVGSATGKSKVEQAQEAQQEQRQIVAAKRVEYLTALQILQQIGGEDDVEGSIVTIVNAFPNGIEFPFLAQAVPNAKTKHREKLVAGGLIIQEKKGQSYVLKPATTKPTAQ